MMKENKKDTMELNEKQLEEVTGGSKKGEARIGLKDCIYGQSYEHDFVNGLADTIFG